MQKVAVVGAGETNSAALKPDEYGAFLAKRL